ncbi:hypothetical protein Hanom_Chr00s000001g01592071 [Helianthus anomalus]
MTKMTTRSSLVTSPEKDNTPQSQNLLMNPSSDIYKFTNPEIESHAPCFPLENVFRPFDPLVCNDAIFPPSTPSTRFSKVKSLSSLSELSYLYSLVTHDSSRFLFKTKPHQPLPILKTTQNNSTWKNQFFFVRRDSIPNGGSLPKNVAFKPAKDKENVLDDKLWNEDTTLMESDDQIAADHSSTPKVSEVLKIKRFVGPLAGSSYLLSCCNNTNTSAESLYVCNQTKYNKHT